MNKRLPPLNWIRSFEAAARHLSFTHAALELNLTQAAVSQQVKGLESQLGAILFKRLPRGLELTNAGSAYLPAVHESIDRLKIATEELFDQGRTNLLTVKVNLVFLLKWLAPKISRFRALHPDINLRITSNIWNVDRENSADCDLEIRYGKGKWLALKSDRLTKDELFPVCSPGFLKKHTSLQTPNDLQSHTLFHVIGYEEGWGYWLNQTNHEHIKISHGFQFDTLTIALEMAALGEGLALGRTSLVEGMIKSGQLVAPFEQKVATEEGFYLVYATSQLNHPNAEAFRNWILQEITQ
jgi:LysR family glycine cleavage system transcriptional activator